MASVVGIDFGALASKVNKSFPIGTAPHGVRAV